MKTALAIAAMILVIGSAIWFVQERNEMKAASAERWVRSGLPEKLEEYKASHGVYPRSLEDLEWHAFEEGADKRTIQKLDCRYFSSGAAYELRE